VKILFKKALENIIFSNLLVSISIGTLCYGICHQLKIPNELWYGSFVFSSTLMTYNFQRLIKSNQIIQNPTNHLLWVQTHKKNLYILFYGCSILCLVSFLKVYNWGLISVFTLSISLVISFLYVLKIKTKTLRDIPYLKIHLIAIIWVIAIGIFELLNEKYFTSEKWGFVLAHYFYIVAVTIPFDIRDLKYDDPSHRTIPQVFGIIKAKIISVLFLIIYFLIAINEQQDLIKNVLFIGVIIYTIILIITSNKNRNEFHYSGLIEGSILLLGLSLIL
jgi:hypothetical protein